MRITLRLPDDLAERLKALAESRERSINWMIVKAITSAVEDTGTESQPKTIVESRPESQAPVVSEPKPKTESRVEVSPPKAKKPKPQFSGFKSAQDIKAPPLHRCPTCGFTSRKEGYCPDHAEALVWVNKPIEEEAFNW